MQFLHAADLHLDSPLRGLARHDDAPVDEIRRSARRAFERLVETAVDRQVAFVVLAGDIFDGDRPDMNTALFFRNRLSLLAEAGIPVFLLHGNHDAANAVSHGVDLPEGVFRFGAAAPDSFALETAGGPVALHGQSFAAAAESRNLAAGYPAPVPGHLNIGVLHTALDGRPGHEPYAPCSLADLAGKGYDYWALGHVHAREVVAQDPWIVYPGNLQGRHVRETGPKGACLVTVEHGRVAAADFLDLDVFRWADRSVDVSGAETLDAVVTAVRADLAAAVGAADGRPLAVRLRLSGDTGLHAQIAAGLRDLRERVLVAAFDVARGAVWLESLRAETRPVGGGSGPDAGDIADLMAVLEELRGEPETLKDMVRAVAGPLSDKLPDGTRDIGAVAALEDPQAAQDLADAAIARIAALFGPDADSGHADGAD